MSARLRSVGGTIAHHTVLLAIATMFLAPLAMMVLTSLMDDDQALTRDLWPHGLHWRTYVEIFHTSPLWMYFANTMLVATLTTVGVVVSSVPVAYALSHLRWRGRQWALMGVLFVYLLPAQATVVPLYILFAKLGWIGSFKPLVVPSFFGDAFTIFLLRQFFLTVPRGLTDVARVEGAGELQVLWRVVLPLTRPAIAAAALLHFMFCWNDFYYPNLYVGSDRNHWMLSMSVNDFRGLHSVVWNQLMAASTVIMLPVVVVFLLVQRQVVSGFTLPGRDPTA